MLFSTGCRKKVLGSGLAARTLAALPCISPVAQGETRELSRRPFVSLYCRTEATVHMS